MSRLDWAFLNPLLKRFSVSTMGSTEPLRVGERNLMAEPEDPFLPLCP